MLKSRTLIIIAVLAVLVVLGGWMNNQREKTSACGDEQYTTFVRPEMIDGGRGKGYKNISIYYSALEAAIASDRLESSARQALEAEWQTVQDDIENAVIDAREVSPSSATDLTCVYELTIGKSTVITRFKLVIQDLPGTEFEKSYDKRQRSLILLEELQPGVPVESVKVAKLGLRQFKIKEPQFQGARLDQSFTPAEIIRPGVISELPK